MTDKQERNAEMKTAKEKYGKNHWWASRDPKVRAYHQLNEETLLYSFKQFHEDIETLLGRPVWTHEFNSQSMPRLQQEAGRAYHGAVASDEEKEQIIAAGFQDVQKLTGGKMIVVEVPDKE